MSRYRVGEGGLRVGLPDGVVWYLAPGTVLSEIPDHYEGKLIVDALDETLPTAAPSVAPPESGVSAGALYDDKMLRAGGHGHVRPRQDGAVARCGGPAICPACRQELLARRRALGREQ
jgi:hypothetical protein